MIVQIRQVHYFQQNDKVDVLQQPEHSSSFADLIFVIALTFFPERLTKLSRVLVTLVDAPLLSMVSVLDELELVPMPRAATQCLKGS